MTRWHRSTLEWPDVIETQTSHNYGTSYPEVFISLSLPILFQDVEAQPDTADISKSHQDAAGHSFPSTPCSSIWRIIPFKARGNFLACASEFNKLFTTLEYVQANHRALENWSIGTVWFRSVSFAVKKLQQPLGIDCLFEFFGASILMSPRYYVENSPLMVTTFIVGTLTRQRLSRLLLCNMPLRKIITSKSIDIDTRKCNTLFFIIDR